jgi:hypothetical protein
MADADLPVSTVFFTQRNISHWAEWDQKRQVTALITMRNKT